MMERRHSNSFLLTNFIENRLQEASITQTDTAVFTFYLNYEPEFV